MSIHIIFYVIFASQVILLSYYLPEQMLKRMKTVLEEYPPSIYPKLYPDSVEYYHKGQRRFKAINQIIMAAGVVLLFAIGWWQMTTGGELSPMVPWAYFMLQWLPSAYLEMSGVSQFKKMRGADERTTRKADLRPRHMQDYIPAKLLSLTAAALAVCIWVVLFTFEYDLSPGGKAFTNIAIMVGANLAGIVFAYWLVHSTKLDPYQASTDRVKQLKMTITSLCAVSIGMNIFLMVTVTVDKYGLDFLEPGIMSIYCQLLSVFSMGIMLEAMKLEDINFDVYKGDAPAT